MDLDREIQALVTCFVDDVAALSVVAAREALSAAFGSQVPRESTNAVGAINRKGAKRDAGELDDLRDKLLATIQANPGKRIEEIGRALGLRTRALALPVRQLLASKVVTKKGKKRATTYHPNV